MGPAKMDSKFKNIFENTDSEKEVETRRQPKKKLITLDQVLIKSASQDMKHEKEAELEIINLSGKIGSLLKKQLLMLLRLNWNPKSYKLPMFMVMTQEMAQKNLNNYDKVSLKKSDNLPHWLLVGKLSKEKTLIRFIVI